MWSGTPAVSAAACTWSTASATRSDTGSGSRDGRFLRFDLREVEQIVDDPGEAIRFAHHALGELLQHCQIVGRGHRLGEQRQCPDGCLQFVTDVRDEVATHALDAPRLRDVVRERDCADHLTGRVQRERAQVQHLTRRTVELDLTFGDSAGQRLLQQLGERVLGDDLAMARAFEVVRGRVPQHFPPDPVHDDDSVGCLIERTHEPVLRGLGRADPIIGILLRLLDRDLERQFGRRAQRRTCDVQFAGAPHPADRREGRDAPAGGRDDDEQDGQCPPITPGYPNRPVM